MRGPSGIPDKLMVRLVYSQQLSLTANGINRYVFRGNSVFDPDFTGVGHQPRFFDQYSPLYERYRVHASKINLKIINVDSSVCGLGLIPLTASTSTEIGTITDCQEAPYMKFRWLQGQINQQLVTINSFMKTSAIRGESDKDDDYSAPVTGNPARQWFWHIIAAQSDDSQPTINMAVKLTYYVEFLRRKLVIQS